MSAESVRKELHVTGDKTTAKYVWSDELNECARTNDGLIAYETR